MSTAVISVPNYFTQVDRKAILRAAKLADIEVLQLMNDNAAIALNFAISRRNSLEAKPQFLFYDVGASATAATIVCKFIAIVVTFSDVLDVNPFFSMGSPRLKYSIHVVRCAQFWAANLC